MGRARLALLLLIIGAAVAFFALGLGRFFTLEFLQAQRAAIDAQLVAEPIRTGLLFFLAYVAITGLSLPGSAVMTLAAGAIFGLRWGVAIVSFASTIGATLAFLAARFLLRDWVQAKFGEKLKAVNDGVAREGAFYLFALRLVPAFPFFAINLLMGLTPIRTWTYIWVSQLGMFAGTIVFVYAGTKLGEFRASIGLLAAFALLGFFPLLAKRVLDAAKARRVYARWARPARFDRNLVVVGAGSAGLVAAYIAAAVKAKVTLVEKHNMGGDCLNTGCIPSKALLRSAKFVHQARKAASLGIKAATVEFDFADVMERVQRVIRTVEPHDSAERYAGLGVECLRGEAKIVSPWAVEVAGADGKTQTLTTRAIVIAAGARPFVPPIPGIERMDCLTSDTVWGLRELPPRLLVLGGGPIGSELAQAFARLGSKVTQVEMLPRILPREDPDVSAMVRRSFEEEGIAVLTGHKAKEFLLDQGRKTLVCEREGGETRIEFDVLLCALGRVANTAGYGLEDLGIPVSQCAHRRNQRVPADDLSEHLRLRRCRRALPVHARRRAPGLVRVGKCAVRIPEDVPRRLLGDPLGHFYRSGGGARGPERNRGERKEHPLRSLDLRHRRPGPRDRRRDGARHGQGAHRAGQGPHPRRHHRRRACGRPDRRVCRRDAPRLRHEQDPRHHPYLSDAGGSQQVRRRRVEEGARAAGSAADGGEIPCMDAGLMRLRARR